MTKEYQIETAYKYNIDLRVDTITIDIYFSECSNFNETTYCGKLSHVILM